METVLIVGAGSVGARVARSFTARNYAPDRRPTRVTAWTQSALSARLLAAEGLTLAQAVDIVPPTAIRAAAGADRLPVDPAGYDIVYFCAAPGRRESVVANRRDSAGGSGDRILGGGLPQDAEAVYVAGYSRVLTALEGCAKLPRRMVLAGSTGVIGDHDGAAVDETVARDTTGSRGRVLCACEDLLRDFAARHSAAGVSAAILRLVGLYGPERSPLAALKAGRYRYPGDPDKGINLLHVSDAAAALAAAADLPLAAGATEVIHCSDGGFPSRREYVAAICRRFDLPLPAEAAEPAGAAAAAARSVGDRRIGNEKMRAVLLHDLAFPTYLEGVESLEV